jgi:hypothetical protein
MLGRPREANHPTDKSVVTTVSAPIALGKQFVKTMGRPLAPTRWHIEAQGPQPWGRHRHQQRRFALTARGEIGEPRAHELMTGEAHRHILHAPIVRRSPARTAHRSNRSTRRISSCAKKPQDALAWCDSQSETKIAPGGLFPALKTWLKPRET